MSKLHDKRSDEGFTLIELLVVIVILGILSAVVVLAVGGLTSEGDKAACKSDFKSVETAQEAKKAKDGSYAASVAALSPTYLKNVPSSTKYEISTVNTGVVTGKIDGADQDTLPNDVSGTTAAVCNGLST